MIGTWERPVDILVLNDDGTFRIGVPVGGVDELSYERGQFRFEDRLLTFITGDDSVYCSGQTGSYEVELTEQDELLLTLHEDDCSVRRRHFTKPSSGQLEWNRRSP